MEMNDKVICVYCSSSDAISPVYVQAAEALGTQLARRGWALIYGGGNVGTMWVVARTVQSHKGQVIGVIPEKLHGFKLANHDADELVVTQDMRERKAVMELRADGFVALPGGFGTLEEVLEILTLKQLGYHAKPVVFVNVNGFFDDLLAMFERIYHEQFAKDSTRRLYYVAADVDDALAYIESYQPVDLEQKWFDRQ
jgi:uncharacterized protein (TIGR00730 family)